MSSCHHLLYCIHVPGSVYTSNPTLQHEVRGIKAYICPNLRLLEQFFSALSNNKIYVPIDGYRCGINIRLSGPGEDDASILFILGTPIILDHDSIKFEYDYPFIFDII